MNECKFCKLINIDNCNKRIEDTILYEDSNFIIIPALGSIVEGYLMLITKKHINSMAELSSRNIFDLLNLIYKVKNIVYYIYNIMPIVFEHGSGNIKIENASSSIRHAHIHIVPINFCKNTINKIIKESKMCKFDIDNLSTNYGNDPYILYIDEKNTKYISKSQDVILPSQYIRQWVAKETNVPTMWNWKQFPFLENINLTVEKFNHIII